MIVHSLIGVVFVFILVVLVEPWCDAHMFLETTDWNQSSLDKTMIRDDVKQHENKSGIADKHTRTRSKWVLGVVGPSKTNVANEGRTQNWSIFDLGGFTVTHGKPLSCRIGHPRLDHF